MKKLLFTVILCLTTSIICMGQDVHLQQLTQGVISLRKAASKARNTLVADWSREQMPKITLMDDIGRVPSEARGKGCNPFMLNQVVTYVYSRQNTSMSSKGDYFNSTEKDIYYSAIEKTVSDAGFDPFERKLLGITAMQKLLGKARFEELLGPYLEKPPGKPTLVPDDDDRLAMNTAKNDFMEEYDNE